jgi:hypothetical protein
MKDRIVKQEWCGEVFVGGPRMNGRDEYTYTK